MSSLLPYSLKQAIAALTGPWSASEPVDLQGDGARVWAHMSAVTGGVSKSRLVMCLVGDPSESPWPDERPHATIAVRDLKHTDAIEVCDGQIQISTKSATVAPAPFTDRYASVICAYDAQILAAWSREALMPVVKVCEAQIDDVRGLTIHYVKERLRFEASIATGYTMIRLPLPMPDLGVELCDAPIDEVAFEVHADHIDAFTIAARAGGICFTVPEPRKGREVVDLEPRPWQLEAAELQKRLEASKGRKGALPNPFVKHPFSGEPPEPEELRALNTVDRMFATNWESLDGAIHAQIRGVTGCFNSAVTMLPAHDWSPDDALGHIPSASLREARAFLMTIAKRDKREARVQVRRAAGGGVELVDTEAGFSHERTLELGGMMREMDAKATLYFHPRRLIMVLDALNVDQAGDVLCFGIGHVPGASIEIKARAIEDAISYRWGIGREGALGLIMPLRDVKQR